MLSPSEYTASKIIRTFDEGADYKIGKVKFYKVGFTVHKELLKKDRDIRLPWFWFKHGPEVDLDTFPEHVLSFGEPIEHPEWGPYAPLITQVEDGDPIDFDKEMKNAIDEEVFGLYEIWRSLSGDDTRHEVYKRYSPHDFEIPFRKFCKGFKKEKLDYTSEDIVLLKQLRNLFPYDEFVDLVPVFLEWQAFVNTVITHSPKHIWVNPGLIKDFQSLYGWKMSVSYNQNRDPSKIHWSRNTYQSEVKQFCETMIALKRAFYKNNIIQPETNEFADALRESILEELRTGE